MRIAPRGFRSAVVGFVLILLVAFGGMTWATIKTVELAGGEAKERFDDRVRLALWIMDSYVLQALGQEQARPPLDYKAVHPPEKESIWWYDGRAIDSSKVIQRSRLLFTQPRQDWIDLYFQVDGDGRWTSPQIPEETPSWVLWQLPRDDKAPMVEQLRSLLANLKKSLAYPELQQEVRNALARAALLPSGDPRSGEMYGPHPQPDTKAQLASRGRKNEFQRRALTQKRAQQGPLPREQCWPAKTGQTSVDDIEQVEFADAADDFDCEMSVAISDARFATFWLDSDGQESRRLLFVRSGLAGEQVFYQGFVANWTKLKIKLLEEIEDLFPQADLEATKEESQAERDGHEASMTMVPARLTGQGLGPPQGWEAWSSSNYGRLAYWLIAGWGVVLAVIGVAGWGFFNLINSSSRRMQFAYAVTHELRTPLTTFQLYTDMLAAGLVPDEAKQEYLETLNKEAGRLSGLVEDVLEYARLENHKVRLNPVNTNGDSLMDAVAQDLRTRCAHSGIQAQTMNDIPDSQSLRTDVDLVHQITNVLVNNACRHAAPKNASTNGEDPAKVLLHLSSDNGHIHVNVIDTGPGIERLDARDIFKPFRRGRNADVKAQGGVGLGLALARTWAQLLDGRLELAARHHPTYGGAHFRLTIPSRLDA